jgi:N-acetylmuramoyl-L-alanine amidase
MLDNIPEIKRVNKEFKKGSYAAFVSIHCNSYGPSKHVTTWVGAGKGYGGSIVFTGKNSGKHPQSDILGAMVAKSLNSAWKRQGEMTGLKVLKSSTTVAHASYMVLSDKTSPAILIETGYVNHADDVKWMETPDGIDKLTTAIANAIKEWLSTVKN